MATIKERIRYNLFKKKESILTLIGAHSGLIVPYPDEYLDKMSNYMFHGIPGSIVLMGFELCNGNCLQIGPFLTLGLQDEKFTLYYAYINSIKYNPLNIDIARNNNIKPGLHCFIEVQKDKNKIIYDPTRCLIYDKKLYFEIEKPQIISSLPKEEMLNNSEYINIQNNNKIDDYAEERLLPYLETPEDITTMHKERLLKEIKNFNNAFKKIKK